jgi:hypothetical protein
MNLWEPLLLHVLKRGGRGNGEADEEDVGLRVGERAEPVVILLTCVVSARVHSRIWLDLPAVSNSPKVYGSSPIMTVTASVYSSAGAKRPRKQRPGLAVSDLGVPLLTIVKHSRDIFRGKLVRGVRDQKTCPESN